MKKYAELNFVSNFHIILTIIFRKWHFTCVNPIDLYSDLQEKAPLGKLKTFGLSIKKKGKTFGIYNTESVIFQRDIFKEIYKIFQ